MYYKGICIITVYIDIAEVHVCVSRVIPPMLSPKVELILMYHQAGYLSGSSGNLTHISTGLNWPGKVMYVHLHVQPHWPSIIPTGIVLILELRVVFLFTQPF